MSSQAPVVLITGSAHGIGFATAQKFFANGYNVAISDLSDEDIASALKQLDSQGDRSIGLKVDVTSRQDIEAGVAKIIAKFGRLDVLVNNAGNFRQGATDTYSDSDWDQITSVHLDGAFKASQIAYPHLKKSPAGAIVSVSSIVARVGLPMRASYSVSKAGIEALTRTLAVEWASDGIRINAVAPGFTESRWWQDLQDRGLTTPDKLVAAIPLRRLGKMSEQAAAIYFLASSEASFITGQTLVVDGGTTVDVRI
ncbi:MAG: SDR family NAD(P)-dependent oxidoreductase [Actinomycetota bacterium]|jgi:3-oxoacyl-[acyl-carrier protein] reductase|uniref:SDR family NAD(P)-dependent oxidoreductase n=1 Tax=Candidatus Planktophila sp. TaxID=2175601 RepID=UPI002A0731A8|nr:SDR family NAD(P)-dependent oxidoreductase [Actinomycetota bacterium]